MGRKRKDIDDYVQEYAEFEAVSLKGRKMFTCKSYRTTVDIESRAADNIKAHLSSKTHERLSSPVVKKARMEQMTMEQCTTRAWQNIEETADIPLCMKVVFHFARLMVQLET